MVFTLAQTPESLPGLPTGWLAAILGPYGAVIVLLIVIYLLLTTKSWGLVPRHSLTDHIVKIEEELEKTEARCDALKEENKGMLDTVKISVMAASEAALTTKRSVEALDIARVESIAATKRSVDALEEVRAEYTSRLENLERERGINDRRQGS